MNITDFLLARIAEDEALALASVERDVFAPTQGPDMARLHDDDEYDMLLVGAGHVLAECEAKRRIVTDRSFLDIHGDLSVFGERILGWLATVYADHPDYRDEWKP